MTQTRKGLFVGLSCGGSLPSALYDLVHMTEHAVSRMNLTASDIMIMVESENDKARVLHLFQNEPFFNGKQEAKTAAIPVIQVTTTRAQFLTSVTSLLNGWQTQYQSSRSRGTSSGLDILLMISTHGYCVHHTSSFNGTSGGGGKVGAEECKEDSGCDESIHLNGEIIIDDELHNAIVSPLKSPGISLLTLVDTCHSGTMLDLPFWTIDMQHSVVDGKVDPSCLSTIYSISACSDSESSMDDVSMFGFDGGLIAAFLDSWKPGQSVRELYAVIRDRLKRGGQTSILSSNQAFSS